MSAPKPHEIRTCPYNKAHQVEQYRMHIHLQKCRKQHPGGALSVCPFDATHIIRNVELDFHIQKCPKRIMFDAQKYVADDDHCPVVDVQPCLTDTTPSENWEDDDEQSYNPLEAKKGAMIIQKSIKGATKSQRNAARMEGRLRYQAAMRNQQTE